MSTTSRLETSLAKCFSIWLSQCKLHCLRFLVFNISSIFLRMLKFNQTYFNFTPFLMIIGWCWHFWKCCIHIVHLMVIGIASLLICFSFIFVALNHQSLLIKHLTVNRSPNSTTMNLLNPISRTHLYFGFLCLPPIHFSPNKFHWYGRSM